MDILLPFAAFLPPLPKSRVISVPPLTLAQWPPKGGANNCGCPANLSAPCLEANPLSLAGVTRTGVRSAHHVCSRSSRSLPNPLARSRLLNGDPCWIKHLVKVLKMRGEVNGDDGRAVGKRLNDGEAIGKALDGRNVHSILGCLRLLRQKLETCEAAHCSCSRFQVSSTLLQNGDIAFA